jgi:hypothetical protein
MADEAVPEDIGDFIARYIDSIAQLEALLLLRSDPGTKWDAAGAAKRLYTTEQDAAEVLSRLREDGLISCRDGIYRYGGLDSERGKLVERLAEIYSRQLIAVTNMIHAKPRRIRQFADAFKFRKDR